MMTSISFGADDRTPVTEAVLRHLERTGSQFIVHGPPAGGAEQWAEVAELVAGDVIHGRAHTGIVCCHTGTGVSIAANKLAGIRAALCRDPATAEGARRWNAANVLCLSLASTSPDDACAIVDAWLAPFVVDPAEQASIDRVHRLEHANLPPADGTPLGERS